MINELTEEYIAECLRRVGRPAYSELPANARPGSLRRAAVLIPLTKIDNDWHLLYTRRTDLVEHHKSQVSFPGGAMDATDLTPDDTALREAEEEVGLHSSDVHVLGRLSQMVTVTSFVVTPVVGVIPWPYTFAVSNIEVGRVFTMPLVWLADNNNFLEFRRPGTGHGVIVYFPYDGELLWGATARMTVEFLKTIGLIA
jgi:8-oxo-dGTP pyrophosphatase MutT (NUDIX family)